MYKKLLIGLLVLGGTGIEAAHTFFGDPEVRLEGLYRAVFGSHTSVMAKVNASLLKRCKSKKENPADAYACKQGKELLENLVRAYDQTPSDDESWDLTFRWSSSDLRELKDALINGKK